VILIKIVAILVLQATTFIKINAKKVVLLATLLSRSLIPANNARNLARSARHWMFVLFVLSLVLIFTINAVIPNVLSQLLWSSMAPAQDARRIAPPA
jgi:hypothetical protein